MKAVLLDRYFEKQIDRLPFLFPQQNKKGKLDSFSKLNNRLISESNIAYIMCLSMILVDFFLFFL